MPNQKIGMFIDNPETFVDTTLYRGGEIGMVYNAPGSTNHYQLVQLGATSDAAGVAGDVCYWLDPTAYTITMTIAEGLTGTGNGFAGIIMYALPVSSYGFIKFKGKHSCKAASGTKGVTTVPHTGSNQVADIADGAAELMVHIGACYSNAAAGYAGILLHWHPV
jgi:hypothetical protein